MINGTTPFPPVLVFYILFVANVQITDRGLRTPFDNSAKSYFSFLGLFFFFCVSSGGKDASRKIDCQPRFSPAMEFCIFICGTPCILLFIDHQTSIPDGSALGYRLAPNHWSMIISSALCVFFLLLLLPSLFDLAQKFYDNKSDEGSTAEILFRLTSKIASDGKWYFIRIFGSPWCTLEMVTQPPLVASRPKIPISVESFDSQGSFIVRRGVPYRQMCVAFRHHHGTGNIQ